MRKLGATVVLAGLSLVLLSAPNAASPPAKPGGRLVLSLLGPGGAVSGEWVAVVDVRTGKTVRRALPGGTLCHAEISVSGGRVLFAGSDHGRAATMSLDLTLQGRPRTVRRSDIYIRSATEGRVWVGDLRYGRHPLMRLREQTLAGRTTAVPPRGVSSWSLHGAFAGGLVFDHRAGLGIWDPRTGRWTRSMPRAFLTASHPDRIAWCSEPCRRLHVTDARGEVTVKPTGRTAFTPGEGAFSADGSLLAVPVGDFERARVALIDPERRSVERIPGARVGTYSALAWSRSGDWLFYATPRGRLMAYRPGAERPLPLPVRFPETVMSITAG